MKHVQAVEYDSLAQEGGESIDVLVDGDEVAGRCLDLALLAQVTKSDHPDEA